MCGRTRCTLARDQVLSTAGAQRWVGEEQYHPSYNASPGFAMPVVHMEGGAEGGTEGSAEPIVHTMRWGLIPSFTKPGDDPDYFKMFNARSESLAEKPSFRRLVPSRRCLVLVEGFYEWKKEKDGKQPYYVHLSTGEPLVMAGLFDVWQSAKGPVHTFTILTTDSSKRLEWLHDRMPVILRDKEAQERWLRTDNKSGLGTLHQLYVPYNGEDLIWYPVTRQMNNMSFQGPECAKEVKKPSVASFFKPRRPAGESPASAAPAAAAAAAAVKTEADVKQEEAGQAAVAAAPEAGHAVKSESAVKAEGVQDAVAPAQSVTLVKQEGEEDQEQGHPGAGGVVAAAVNTDQQPADHQSAAAASSAGQQEAQAAEADDVKQLQKATPQKRKQSEQGGGKGGGGSRKGQASASRKAKLPGQLNITKFFGN